MPLTRAITIAVPRVSETNTGAFQPHIIINRASSALVTIPVSRNIDKEVPERVFFVCNDDRMSIDMAITLKRQFGNIGEKAATRYLAAKGFIVLDVNFQNSQGRRLGEIDIIARDKKSKEIVFVEVKTRNHFKYQHTSPEENITYAKMLRMSKAADAYLRIKHLEDAPFRFDAISVWLDVENKTAKIKHIENI